MSLRIKIVILMSVAGIQAIAQQIDRIKGEAGAVHVTSPISIDGNLTDWDKSFPLLFKEEKQVISSGLWAGPDDFSALVYLMWDNSNLYIAAEVTDDIPFRYLSTPQIDGVDALVLYINTDTAAYTEGELFSSTDFRILFGLDNNRFPTAIDRDAVLNKKGFQTVGMSGDRNAIEGYRVAVREVSTGYLLEMQLPFKTLMNDRLPLLEPSNGMCISFNLQFIDLDQASEDEVDSIGDRVAYITFFPGQPDKRPDDWGYLEFK